MQGHPGRFADHAVGHAAQEVSSHRRVRTLLPPTRHHIPTLIELVQEAWNICGIVLQVGIKGHDHLVRCRIDAGLHRRGLSGVPPEGNHPNPSSGVSDLTKDFERPIGRTVVDKDHFNIKRQ